MADKVMQPDDAGQQRRTADQGIGEIDCSAFHRLVGTAMDDQREGRQRQQFVEDKEREQVGRHGDTHGGRDAQTEETEESAAMRCTFEVTNGIERGEQPEDGREGDEQQAQGIGLERQVEAGQHLEAHAVAAARMNTGQQQENQSEFSNGAEQVERGPYANPGFRQGEDHQPRQQRGCQYGQRQEFVRRHVLAPSNLINSTPRSPSKTLAAAKAKALHSSARGTAATARPSGASMKA